MTHCSKVSFNLLIVTQAITPEQQFLYTDQEQHQGMFLPSSYNGKTFFFFILNDYGDKKGS